MQYVSYITERGSIMGPYVLRLVEINSDERKYLHSDLDLRKRKELKKKLSDGGHLYCNCLYPQQKIELYFSADGRIVPMHQKYQHAEFCPKSELSKQMAQYNSAFGYMDDEQQKIRVNVSLDFSKKKREEVCGGPFVTYKKPQTTRKMTVTAMIKKLNMLTFQIMASSTKEEEYPGLEDFCRWVIWKEKDIFISNEKSLRDLSVEVDGKKFFYGKYEGARETSATYLQLGTKIFYSKKDKNTGKYKKETYLLNMSYNKDGLELAYEEFEKTYNGLTVTAAMERGYNIVCSGFYTREGKYNKCLDVHFILVNKGGLFSESKYEVEMYDYILDYLNENHLKTKYIFYKPWEFGWSIYKNHYLEDGIIYNKETDETYYVEVFGMNTPEYLETKMRKEQLAEKQLIKWNAFLKEDKPNLDEYLQ